MRGVIYAKEPNSKSGIVIDLYEEESGKIADTQFISYEELGYPEVKNAGIEKDTFFEGIEDREKFLEHTNIEIEEKEDKIKVKAVEQEEKVLGKLMIGKEYIEYTSV